MTALNLTEAVDMFVMNKFGLCFNECITLIKAAKYETNLERNHKLIEAATALGIQALAETDSWYCVVAFITDVYDSVDLCPPSIIKLCILLHAQVKEYLPCHKVVEIWLKNPHNQKHEQYSQVVRTYAYHVLCPTGSYSLLRKITENCDSLTEDERTALIQLSQTKRYKESKCLADELDYSALADALPINGIETDSERPWLRFTHNNDRHLSDVREHDPDDCIISGNNEATHSRSDTLKRSSGSSRSQTFCNWLYEVVLTKINYFRHSGFSVFLVGILAVWALIQTQTGDPVSSLGRFVILWKLFIQKVGLLLSNNLMIKRVTNV